MRNLFDLLQEYIAESIDEHGEDMEWPSVSLHALVHYMNKLRNAEIASARKATVPWEEIPKFPDVFDKYKP